MRKRYILIVLLIIITLAIIIVNISLYRGKEIKGDSYYKVVDNDQIMKKHCEKSVCINDLKIIYNKDLTVFKGYIENQTTEDLNTYISFVFDLGNDKISYGMRFENLKSFEKQYFEYHTIDNRLLNTKDYALKVS
ncbi:MAG: hypothetical protein IJL76_02675 [Bacilli bacterium]|nr:hypothetical protein [Bacilli bacterium]